jgi:hypothetical protein
MTTAKSQRLSFVIVNGGNDYHRRTAAAVDGSGGDDVFATAVNNDNRMVADRPLLLPLPQLPPMLPPPRPCPCLRRHHCCSLCQRHCPSNSPVDGWLL